MPVWDAAPQAFHRTRCHLPATPACHHAPTDGGPTEGQGCRQRSITPTPSGIFAVGRVPSLLSPLPLLVGIWDNFLCESSLCSFSPPEALGLGRRPVSLLLLVALAIFPIGSRVCISPHESEALFYKADEGRFVLQGRQDDCKQQWLQLNTSPFPPPLL